MLELDVLVVNTSASDTANTARKGTSHSDCMSDIDCMSPASQSPDFHIDSQPGKQILTSARIANNQL